MPVTKAGDFALGVNDYPSGEIVRNVGGDLAFQGVGECEKKSLLVVQIPTADLAIADMAFEREFDVRRKFSINVGGDLFCGTIERKLCRRILHLL